MRSTKTQLQPLGGGKLVFKKSWEEGFTWEWSFENHSGGLDPGGHYELFLRNPMQYQEESGLDISTGYYNYFLIVLVQL